MSNTALNRFDSFNELQATILENLEKDSALLSKALKNNDDDKQSGLHDRMSKWHPKYIKQQRQRLTKK